MSMNQEPMSEADRFWSKVKNVRPDECWLWQAGTIRGGYGHFWLRSKNVLSHRIALFGFDGPYLHDREIVAAHFCDNPPCCNPEHLFITTTHGNNLDRELKGRGAQPSGENHGRAKLTEQEVLSIKEILAHGTGTQKQIADYFGVSREAISKIKTGNTWNQ